MSTATGDIVSRIYGSFRGCDFRGEEINLARSPDSLNVWKDYKEIESIRTRPGMKLDVSFPNPVYGVFFFNGKMLVHSGTNLYTVSDGGQKKIIKSDLRAAESHAFIYDNVWYFKDGKHYLQYDGEEIKDVEGYIPTTSIARQVTSNSEDGTVYGGYIVGGGTQHEDVNMLSDYRINTFLADGKGTFFHFDTTGVDIDSIQVWWINEEGEEELCGRAGTDSTANYTYEPFGSFVEFVAPPPAPPTDGQDNVKIQFKKHVDGYREAILNCTMLQMFDNRVFFSGNPDPKYANTIFHCSLNKPSYVSDTDYYREGMDTADVKGMVAGNNALWVFREPSESNTNVFYHTPTTDEQYGKVYPSVHSSVTIGCVGKAINFNDDIVFFSDRGMEGISGDVTTEQVVGHRSTLVDRKMISDSAYRNMVLEEWAGYLLIFIGNKVFLADSRTIFTNENHIEYEFFYWELEKSVISTRVYNGVLYIGTEDGVYTMTDKTTEDGVYTVSADPSGNIESYWVTPKDKFKVPHKLKTTNKRGCVVEATGDVTVYAKTDSTDFELIGTYENITDDFVCRIKRKKWKDIQLKFHSNTRFSLETATLEAFVGGYKKR